MVSAAAPRLGAAGAPQPSKRVATEAAATMEASTSSPVMSKVEMWNGKKLQTQVFPLAKDTVAIRSLDWDRDRFDIEFGWVPVSERQMLSASSKRPSQKHDIAGSCGGLGECKACVIKTAGDQLSH